MVVGPKKNTPGFYILKNTPPPGGGGGGIRNPEQKDLYTDPDPWIRIQTFSH